MAKTADDQHRVRLAVGSAPRHLLMAVLLEGAVIVGAAAVLGGAAILVSLMRLRSLRASMS